MKDNDGPASGDWETDGLPVLDGNSFGRQHGALEPSACRGLGLEVLRQDLHAVAPPERAAETVPRLLEAFRPQLLFISAGFDAHREDPLANLNLTDGDYAWITAQIAVVAARHARGRIVSTLEGGYALSALGRSAAAHVRTLIGA